MSGGRLPDGWRVAALGAIVEDVQTGFAQAPHTCKHGVLQLRTHNVTPDGTITLANAVPVEVTEAEHRRYQVRRGDIVFNNTNSMEWVGKTAYYGLDADCVFSNHMTRIRVYPSVADARYVAGYLHWLHAVGDAARRAERWVSQAAIDQETLAGLRIPLPPLAEQARIVEILDEAASLRDLRRQADDKAREFLPALFQSMFGDPAGNGYQWPVIRLGDEDLLDDLSYGTSAKCSSDPNAGVPVLRIPNVIGGAVDLSDLRYAKLPTGEQPGVLLQEGDVLFVRTNGNRDYVGRCAVFEESGTFAFASYLIRARPNPKRLQPWYLSIYLQTQTGRRHMDRYIQSTAGQSNLGMPGIRNVPVRLPPLEIQMQFVRHVRDAEDFRAASRTAQEAAGRLVQQLAARAFTGELTASWRARCKPAAHPRGNVAEAMAKVQRDHDALISSGIGRWLDNVASAQSSIAKWAQLADQQRRQFDGIFKQASRIAGTTSWLEPIIRRQDQLTRMIEQTQWLSSTGAGLQAMAERWARQRAALTPSADFLRAVSADLEALRQEQLRRSNPFAAELSARQLALLDRVHAAAAYVTAESLVEADRDLVLVQVRQDLELLAALGLLIPLSAYDSASGVWSTAYRLPEDRDRVLPEALAAPAETAEATP